MFIIEYVSFELEDYLCDFLIVDCVFFIFVVMEFMKEFVKMKNKEGNEEFNFIV